VSLVGLQQGPRPLLTLIGRTQFYWTVPLIREDRRRDPGIKNEDKVGSGQPRRWPRSLDKVPADPKG
jgi:hypothetical protein